MADKLSVFNGTLRLCKERRLVSLTENREPRRLLDDAWEDGATGGVVKRCLEYGQWTFATRSGRIDYDPDISPEFGYRYAFSQPEDMVRPTAICSDEFFREPLIEYRDERQYWYAPIDTIYAAWVSNGATYGADLSLWPETFVELVQAELADEIVFNLTEDKEIRAFVAKNLKAAKLSANSSDAMRKPPGQLPTGSWLRARQGRRGGRDSFWNGQFSG